MPVHAGIRTHQNKRNEGWTRECLSPGSIRRSYAQFVDLEGTDLHFELSALVEDPFLEIKNLELFFNAEAILASRVSKSG